MKKLILDPIVLYSIDELSERVKQELIEEEICGYLYDEGIDISEDEALEKLRDRGSRYLSDGDSMLVINGSIFLESHEFTISSVTE